jgi:dihydrofolate synthase / folylpolyglutamate synthase
MPKIKTFAEAEAALKQLPQTPLKRHLQSPEHMLELMDYLGNPQERYRVVHIAGTSGKTSTAYYAAALLQAAGYNVGLTISPHVDSLAERAQLNSTPLTEEQFAREFGEFWELVRASGLAATYFEVFTAFAFWEFARQQVDWAVVEVGIGGLADSTNVVTRQDKVCLIADIGFGHRKVLGNTVPEIAAQKAGIIQLHNQAFCFRQSEEVMIPIQKRAAQKHADLHILDQPPTPAALADLPLFQQRNFALAEAAITTVLAEEDGPKLGRSVRIRAAHISIPARMEQYQVAGKTVVIDAAHNPQKLRTLTASLEEAFPGQPRALLMGLLSEKGVYLQEMAEAASELSPYVLLTGWPADSAGRYAATEPGKVAAMAEAQGLCFDVEPDCEAAFRRMLERLEPVIVVTGSFYLLNHIRPLLQ